MNRMMKVCGVLSTIMGALACFDLVMVMVCMQVESLAPAAMNFILGGAGCAVSAIAFDALATPPEDSDGGR